MPTINGTEGPDALSDTTDADIINGLGGDDVITFDDLNTVDGTTDQANGGAGSDTLVITQTGTGLTRLADPVPSAGGGFEGEIRNFGPTTVRIAYTSIERFIVTTDGGQDFLVFATGNDEAYLGSGDDFVDVGSGENTADGGTGTDRISADLSADTGGISWDLFANTYSGLGSFTNFEVFDTITTGSGNDTLIGGTQGPTFPAELNLGAGNDSASIQSAGAYDVYGGSGSDRLIVNYVAATQAVSAFATPNGSGFDGIVTDNAGRVVDFFEIEHFTITTGSGNDQLTLYSGDDVVSLGAGSDTVDLGSGLNQGDGGTGTDRVAVDMSTATVAINWNLQTNSYSGPAGTNFTNFEQFGLFTFPANGVITGSGADTLVTGTAALSDEVSTGGGADSITVAGGYDFVYAGAGFDTLIVNYGGATTAVTTDSGPAAGGDGFSGRYNPSGAAFGVDYTGIDRFLITTGSGNDSIATGSGNDIVSTGGGNDFVDVGSGSDQADGGAGTDRIRADMSAATTAIVWNIQTNSYVGPLGTSFTNFESFFELFTGSGNDVIVTSFSTTPEEVVTGAGNDTVTVGGGIDYVYDNAGFDTLIVDYSANTAGVTTTAAPVFNAGLGGFSGVYTASGTGTVDYDGFDRFLITTGSGADNIVTANGNDTVSTGAGNDRLEGMGGDDQLDGGSGDDEMIGGAGDDVYTVDSSADIVTENASEGVADEIRTGLATYSISSLANIERLTGTSGAGQTLTGNAAANVISGGSGSDTINGGAGDDLMIGGAGDDTYRVGSAGDEVIEASGNGDDEVVASVSYTLAAGSEVETLSANLFLLTAINLTGNEFGNGLTGNAGSNVLNGLGGNDVIQGLGGNDRLDGGTGVDRTEGGTGDDWHYVDNAADVVIELSGQGDDRVFASASYALGAGQSIETLSTTSNAGTGPLNLTGNALANTIIGNAGANVLTGGGGGDVLIGFGGNDTLVGGAGSSSTLQGGLGNDIYRVFTGSDTIIEVAGEGTDRIYAAVSFVLLAGREIESVFASDPASTAALDLTGNAFGQVLWGNAGANVLIGGGGADYLIGGAGNDILYGNADANSTLQGGTGDDRYYVSRTGDSILEFAGEGNDRVLASINYTLTAGKEIEELSTANLAGTTALNLTGNGFAQTIIGNNGANILGGAGGADNLAGFGGNDILVGGDGDDILNGGADYDILNGGAGADSFVFANPFGPGLADRIQDFVSGLDRILLENDLFTGLPTGALSANAFRTGGAALDADDRILYNPATGQLFFDADGNAAGAAVQFSVLSGAPALTASDFTVI